MSEEEILRNIKEMIQWSDRNTYKLALQGLLDLYNKEKEQNTKLKRKINAVLESIDTKPYTAYTFYGDVLYDDEDIKNILED